MITNLGVIPWKNNERVPDGTFAVVRVFRISYAVNSIMPGKMLFTCRVGPERERVMFKEIIYFLCILLNFYFNYNLLLTPDKHFKFKQKGCKKKEEELKTNFAYFHFSIL